MIHTLLAAMLIGQPGPRLPEVTVTSDNTLITSSCRIVIPPGTVLADADGDGVIQVRGDNITVEFAAGSELRGASPATPGDELTGFGLVIDGGRRVSIVGARVHGYKVGIHARNTTALTLDGADLSDNFRRRLRSTPRAEDSSDWLFPHRNDQAQWTSDHGAALWILESRQATVRGVRCRRTQNGIVLDRVNDSKVYDNDCSFLSGWGLALWRSSRNVITRNALDFCVRGHVEGVYNRGQDSAGILMFEQCSNNTIAENSVTHGGDGVFAFAGIEAIGDGPAPANFNYTRKGCNENLFLRNDLSYASAHGLEITFSYANRIIENRFDQNAICGVWGGYSQDTVITGNSFSGNGGMAYGLERGAINMEHAAGNKIFRNTFLNNKVAVHMWWDNDAVLLEKPGVKRNYKAVSANVIAENEVVVNADHPFRNLPADFEFLAWQFRDVAPPAPPADSPARSARRKDENVRDNQLSQNVVLFQGVRGRELAADPGIEFRNTGPTPRHEAPRAEVLGKTTPVGARRHLAGRQNIIMDEWGPWDHESPLLRPSNLAGTAHVYELLGSGSAPVTASVEPTSLLVQTEPGLDHRPARITVSGRDAVQPYALTVRAGPSFERVIRGTLMPARWNIAFFAWDEQSDPRENLDAWRRLAETSTARATLAGPLNLPFGSGGPRNLNLDRKVGESGIGSDRFGTVASTRISLAPGKWRFWTLSDDGVRVTVNDTVVIENWTWHAPTRDAGEFVMEREGQVTIRVEHFEIDGYSVLELGIEQVR
ncbi:MAG: right-handed parallel beta-helix repeat-containing protein [Phycisphaeraceae bacterium]|nr:right-handed parallel beta-helix repeat-containing protein [Phycisphaeraceae bacterium]